MSRCIAILGAQGVGKSTLTDRLSALDSERAAARPPAPRRSEIEIVTFGFLDEQWCALDCPGSLEFLQQSMDALLAADIAVICASPDPDHAVLTAPFTRLAEQAGVPTVMFINRMDEAVVRVRETADALQRYCSHPLVLRQIPMRREGVIAGAIDLISERAWRYRSDGPSELIEIPPDLSEREIEARGGVLESLSDHDDWLLEELIEDRVPATAPVYEICARLLSEGALMPAFIGSAARGNGITRLMKALRHETPGIEALISRAGQAAQAVAFMARHRRHLGKTIYLRSLTDLTKGCPLGGAVAGQIQVASGDGFAAAPTVAAGQVFQAIKADHLNVGAVYDAAGSAVPDWYTPLPAQLSQGLVPVHEKDEAKLSEAIARLVTTDLSLGAGQDSETGAHVLSGQGVLHLRWAREVLADTFGVMTAERPLAPALRETVAGRADVHHRHKKQSGGAGQFAAVKLSVKPLARGEGFRFRDTIHGGSVPKNYIPAVEAGAREAIERGPLGFPVVDIEVTLTDGQYHAVDSSDMAFKIAARGAVREAIAEAGSVLLEPMYEVAFDVPAVFTGGLNPLVSARRGQVLGFDRLAGAEGWDTFRALLPGSALGDLVADLRAATQGVGRYEPSFDHYQEIYGREAEQMIERRARTFEDA